ncbi:two-component response regulator-like APRR7 isoform X2 [Glycine soja]|nr:two-component response regulator-like APRR7 isoform X2 [Glycine soja]RZB72398.1 Two-component response regulator-like APRR7 isoform C [Glycine soja]RZB72399.1 Two-component response regulator-like APRR7 isoform D [Glycine soja]
MSVDGDGKELRELNQCLRDGKKIAGGERGLYEGDEVKCNGVAEEVKIGKGGIVESSSVQQHIPQPQGAIICWERFLHIRSLKVLLVEYDDSTRHVVTALLRNCSYEVIDAANGLQAWKILEDLTNHIDLILTEVAMPGLSGIGLLYKIMGHKTRKNIPVVMMSSHDSMGLVFKCLSKGAVDFLVKPIRKNELKNLWQHVWRRCHSSSGSGSESGTQTQKSVKSKSLEKFDNNSGSNGEDDNGSIGLNNGDGSDNGSGTQSSWTKHAVEVDSPKPVSHWDKIAECPDSTCAQVVHSNAEIGENKVVPLAVKECPEQKEQLVKTAGSKHSNAPDVGPSKFNDQINRGQLDLNCENQSSKLRCKGLSLSDAITSTSDSQMHSGGFEALYKKPKSSDIENKDTNNDEELPSLELSLKRLRGVEDAGIAIQDDRNVLRRSDQSAFSRYNAASNPKKSPTGCVGSNSPHNNSLEVTKKDSSHDIQSHSSGNPPNQNSNGASNNIDMGSTTNNAYAKSAVISEPAVASTTKCLYQTSAYQPEKNNLVCTSQQVVLHNTEDTMATMLAPPKLDRHKDSAAPDFHLHCENHNCIADNMKHQLPPDHDTESIKKMATAAPHCGSSNAVEVLVEGNVGNHSINRSASGSNNGSNGQNGSSTAVNAGGTNMKSNNGLTGNSGSGDASGSVSANRVDQNKTSQREAALTKFRQKRKERRERCFHKKVRYQSRKRLAEQRPRFRGQFVRQSSNENASEATTDS